MVAKRYVIAAATSLVIVAVVAAIVATTVGSEPVEETPTSRERQSATDAPTRTAMRGTKVPTGAKTPRPTLPPSCVKRSVECKRAGGRANARRTHHAAVGDLRFAKWPGDFTTLRAECGKTRDYQYGPSNARRRTREYHVCEYWRDKFGNTNFLIYDVELDVCVDCLTLAATLPTIVGNANYYRMRDDGSYEHFTTEVLSRPTHFWPVLDDPNTVTCEMTQSVTTGWCD